jgi:GT2 family glycosyltransferase
MSGKPTASIIVPAYRSHDTIAESLASIEAQRFQHFEVIVVDSSPDDRSGRIVRESFPHVQYFRESNRLLPHQARNYGARRSTGRVLVFTDPDCVAEPDWLERLIAHYSSGHEVVGGSMRSSPGWWNRAVTFTKYPWWDPESQGGVRPEIPTGNFSVSRAVWDQVGGFRGQYFAGDSEICWRIRSAGHEIWFDPRAIVTHLDHPALGPFSRERLDRGRDFGKTRVRTQRWNRGRCLAYLIGAPALPFVMTARSAKYALRGNYVGRWLPTAPMQFVGNSLWCLGEAAAHFQSFVLSPESQTRPEPGAPNPAP